MKGRSKVRDLSMRLAQPPAGWGYTRVTSHNLQEPQVSTLQRAVAIQRFRHLAFLSDFSTSIPRKTRQRLQFNPFLAIQTLIMRISIHKKCRKRTRQWTFLFFLTPSRPAFPGTLVLLFSIFCLRRAWMPLRFDLCTQKSGSTLETFVFTQLFPVAQEG